jgi:hypothetical protein
MDSNQRNETHVESESSSKVLKSIIGDHCSGGGEHQSEKRPSCSCIKPKQGLIPFLGEENENDEGPTGLKDSQGKR